MNKLVLLAGVPGSGKTTLSQRLIDKGFVSINADQIREELWGDAAEQSNKEAVFKVFFERLEEGLRRGWDIVIDNTNINGRHREPIIERAKAAGYTDIQIWVVDTPLEVCLERNRLRARNVPEDIVENMHRSLHGAGKPRKHEGRIILVRPGKDQNDFRFFALS
ncbi:MAG: AAA family ATPase [Candidatus Obscuribacterales bacterium]|nr:AAA family ATPase [Candidatus Obscuribacterales bacterium]